MKMAAKRMAGQELNHENWDNEDESEEAGQFKQVPLVVNSVPDPNQDPPDPQFFLAIRIH
jgi:hypothetical protein